MPVIGGAGGRARLWPGRSRGSRRARTGKERARGGSGESVAASYGVKSKRRRGVWTWCSPRSTRRLGGRFRSSRRSKWRKPAVVVEEADGAVAFRGGRRGRGGAAGPSRSDLVYEEEEGVRDGAVGQLGTERGGWWLRPWRRRALGAALGRCGTSCNARIIKLQ